MVNHPSIYPQFSGDILSRTNIFSRELGTISKPLSANPGTFKIHGC